MRPGSWGRDLLELFLPAGCVACGSWIRGAAGLVCPLCRTRLHVPAWPRCPRCHSPRGSRRADEPDCLECRSWPPALTAARYTYSLEGPADDLVHGLKYEGWYELADFMARAMSEVAPAIPPRRLVVPVPTTPERLRERGYNQAAAIADPLARRLGVDVCHALRRRVGTSSQTSLSPDERRRNVKGAFLAEPGAAGGIRGAGVLLIDDVLTTGATAAEAATVLAGLGAESVTLVTFARALPKRRGRAA